MTALQVGVGAALLLVLGCQARLMPTPLVCLRGRIDPYAGFPDGESPNVVELFYATDRNPVDDDDPGDRYGNRRGYLLRLGRATVRVGDPDADWRECRDDTLDGERQPERLTDVHEFGPLWTTVPGLGRQAAGTDDDSQEQPELPAQAFAEAIDRRLALAPTREVTVFVPGINTGFGRPLLLAAGLAHFLGTDGVVVAYSWPVSGNMLAYARDTETVGLASRNLRELLRLLAERTDVERINLLGYSRGAAVVNGALLQLRLLHSDSDAEALRARARIGTVVYAGPDEDVDLFRSLFLDGVDDMVDAFLVYVSAQDRAGWGLWGHSSWTDNPWVSSDLILALRYDLPPAARGLAREDDELMWTFPGDYPERLDSLVAGLRQSP